MLNHCFFPYSKFGKFCKPQFRKVFIGNVPRDKCIGSMTASGEAMSQLLRLFHSSTHQPEACKVHG